MNALIKVGFCVSYDWQLLKNALPRIYQDADSICLSIDKSRKSWSGTPYSFDEAAFKNWVRSVDPLNKIYIYEDDFFVSGLTPMENDNRQRNMMAARMGKDGWHVQIDSDEYFLSFHSFVTHLQRINPNPKGTEKPINVCPMLIPLIKKTKSGYLFVDFGSKIPERAPFATNVPVYQSARRNGHFNVLSPHYVIHETWARSEDELKYKMANWGHAGEEFATEAKRKSYFNLWQSLDEFNYQYIHNFHPGEPSVWPALGFCKGNIIDEFISNFSIPKLPLNKFQLFLLNNRNVAKIRELFKKV